MSTNLDIKPCHAYNCGMKTLDRIQMFPKPEDRHIYYAPSKIWSQRLDVPLHYDWRIKDHKAIQELVLAEPNKFRGSVFVDHLYGVLVSEFPKLLEIQSGPDTRRTLQYDVVLGCLSQFVFDDIKYFIEVDRQDRCPKTLRRLTEIENHFKGEQFNWVISPATLTRIETAIVW